MVDMKNGCDTCVHKSVCKYAETLKKSKDDVMAVVNDHFEAYDFDGFVDLSIRCRHYVMAPYREVPVDKKHTPMDFYYDPILKADVEKMQKHNFEFFPKPDFMSTSTDKQEDKT